MTDNEWLRLIDNLTRQAGGGDVAASAPTPVTRETVSARVEEIAAALRLPAAPQQPALRVPQSAASGSTADRVSDARSTVLRTVGMVTGIGPIATGLLKLFGGRGGGDHEDAAAGPEPFALPPAVAVQAGLRADGRVTPVSYGASDVARDVKPAGSAPQIQIHVQAMDSKSFMDHSDAIAQAVRQALLESHALNDVVAEI